MIEDTDTLLAQAEIAAAFAGFAALVSVLRGSGDRTDIVHDLLRLRLVISSGVAGVVAALVPVGLAGSKRARNSAGSPREPYPAISRSSRTATA